MGKLIHLLDNDTINKIAAGEVIENPKSIVKELVENSIDAGADEIIIEIKNGGKKLIRITDNGKGINRDEIEEAFERHCTSKIKSSDDLETLFTLGFRGEALASIAAVSHVEVISRTPDEQYGIKLLIEGGNVKLKEDVGCPVGTTISVTELFYNVPARKKFLKSDVSESSNINEIVSSLALSKENISFKYISNGNIVFKTPKTNNFINTISSLYDKELYDSLLTVDYRSDILKISGYTTNLNYYRGNRKQQLIFVNNRFIKHKRINYYIEAAYYTLLPKGKYPSCFLKLDIEPSLVDVNVHPAKTEVRFQNEELVLNEVKNAIYKALRTNNIIKEIKKETIIQHDSSNKVRAFDNSIFDENIQYESKENYSNIKYTEINFDHKSNNDKNNFDSLFDSKNLVNIFDDAIKKSAENNSEFIVMEEESRINPSEKAKIERNTEIKHESFITEEKNAFNKDEATSIKSKQENPEGENSINVQQTFIKIEDDIHNSFTGNSIPDLTVIGILMDTYIICENKQHPEMYMIDQHAAHERITYEKFLNEYNNRKIIKQEMLIPEVINLSYDDYFIAMNNIEIFDSIGLSIESFGNNAVLISNVPVVFCKSNIKDLFFTVLDSLRNLNKSNLNLEINKIIKNACVKSVKSGDKLHLSEVNRLIEDLKKTDNPYTCPHGRPVIIKMTKYEIERMFERIQN